MSLSYIWSDNIKVLWGRRFILFRSYILLFFSIHSFRWQPCSMLWPQSTTTRGRKHAQCSTPNTRSSCSTRRNKRKPSWRGTRRPVKNCTASWARWTKRSRGPVLRAQPRTTNSLQVDSWGKPLQTEMLDLLFGLLACFISLAGSFFVVFF